MRQKPMDDQLFWYAIGVAMPRRPGCTRYCYGQVEAANEYKALDKLARQAVNEHGGPMVEAKLHTIDRETGEQSEEPVALMGNVNRSLIQDHGDQGENSQACEQPKGSTEERAAKSIPEFGEGWGTKLDAPPPVIPLRPKETINADA